MGQNRGREKEGERIEAVKYCSFVTVERAYKQSERKVTNASWGVVAIIANAKKRNYAKLRAMSQSQ